MVPVRFETILLSKMKSFFRSEGTGAVFVSGNFEKKIWNQEYM